MLWKQNCEVRMKNNNLLSLVGLCKRAGKLAAGDDAAAEVIQAHGARLVLLASDAGENVTRRIRRDADESGSVVLSVPFDKAALGRAVGRAESAVLALTDVGLASAVTERLAADDPDRYASAAEKLRLKAKRAAERKTARENGAEAHRNRNEGHKPASGDGAPAAAEKSSRGREKPRDEKPASGAFKPRGAYQPRGSFKPRSGGPRPFGGKPAFRPEGEKPRDEKPASGAFKPRGAYQPRGSFKPRPGGPKPFGGKPGSFKPRPGGGPRGAQGPAAPGKGTFRKKDR